MEKCPDQLGWIGHSSTGCWAGAGAGCAAVGGGTPAFHPRAEQKSTSQTLSVSLRAAEW